MRKMLKTRAEGECFLHFSNETLFCFRLTMLFALFKDCNAPLSAEKGGNGCYPLDNHLLCQDCNAIRVQKMTDELDSKPPRPLTTEL